MAISILLTECNWRRVVIIYFLITSLVPFDFHFASRCQIYGTPLLHFMACWGGWHGGRPWSEALDMTSNDNTNSSKNINGNGTSPAYDSWPFESDPIFFQKVVSLEELEERDPVMGPYPFMLAASEHRCDLTAICTLSEFRIY